DNKFFQSGEERVRKFLEGVDRSKHISLHTQAVEAATRYLILAGRDGQHYREALTVLDEAEEALRVEAGRREAIANVERREQEAYEGLRQRLAAERDTVDGAFADPLASGGTGPEMVLIPAGSFEMGCKIPRDPKPGRPVECSWRWMGDTMPLPLHNVRLASFALARHEVTVVEWNACVLHLGCTRMLEHGEGWGGTQPVMVTWDEAQDYVAWLSGETGKTYRLPSEAEWEFAARAETNTRYQWGMDPGPEGVNCCAENRPVASYPPNPFGLYDVHGGAWLGEWVQDCWNINYHGAPRDGSAWMKGDCSECQKLCECQDFCV
ncbi:MAG: formylglycine-generating enzyme family protein, partial [Deltaproteobacteria bacterium]|nr:formylglycine-generating enzyme family protein [Deltaproteobacteria bacterium]